MNQNYSIVSDPILLTILSQCDYFVKHALKLSGDEVEIHHTRQSIEMGDGAFQIERVKENISVTLGETSILRVETITTLRANEVCDVEIIASWDHLLQHEFVEIFNDLNLLGIAQQFGECYGLTARLLGLSGLLTIHISETPRAIESIVMLPAEAVCDWSEQDSAAA